MSGGVTAGATAHSEHHRHAAEAAIWDAERPFVVSVLRNGLGLISARDAVSLLLDTGALDHSSGQVDFHALLPRLKREIAAIPPDTSRALADMPAPSAARPGADPPVISFNLGEELSCKRLFTALLAHYKAQAAPEDGLLLAIKTAQNSAVTPVPSSTLAVARHLQESLALDIRADLLAAALARTEVSAAIAAAIAAVAPEVMPASPQGPVVHLAGLGHQPNPAVSGLSYGSAPVAAAAAAAAAASASTANTPYAMYLGGPSGTAGGISNGLLSAPMAFSQPPLEPKPKKRKSRAQSSEAMALMACTKGKLDGDRLEQALVATAQHLGIERYELTVPDSPLFEAFELALAKFFAQDRYGRDWSAAQFTMWQRGADFELSFGPSSKANGIVPLFRCKCGKTIALCFQSAGRTINVGNLRFHFMTRPKGKAEKMMYHPDQGCTAAASHYFTMQTGSNQVVGSRQDPTPTARQDPVDPRKSPEYPDQAHQSFEQAMVGPDGR